MKNLLKVFFATVFIMISSSSMAVVLNIDFNGTEFNLGTFDTAGSSASFYNYNTDFASSAGPKYPGTNEFIPLQADALQVFTHLDTTLNELSFGIILEKPNGSGGGTFSSSIAWSTPAVLSLVDDTGESGVIGAGGPQNISLQWIDCCTDGFVISGFDPEDLFIDLSQVSGSDLTQVIFLSPDRVNTMFDFPQDEFNISIRPCDPETDPQGCVIPPSPIPVPAAIWLFSTALIGFVGMSRRRKVN